MVERKALPFRPSFRSLSSTVGVLLFYFVTGVCHLPCEGLLVHLFKLSSFFSHRFKLYIFIVFSPLSSIPSCFLFHLLMTTMLSLHESTLLSLDFIPILLTNHFVVMSCLWYGKFLRIDYFRNALHLLVEMYQKSHVIIQCEDLL